MTVRSRLGRWRVPPPDARPGDEGSAAAHPGERHHGVDEGEGVDRRDDEREQATPNPAPRVAAIQIGVVLIGHVIAVVAAHDRSVAWRPSTAGWPTRCR